LCCGCVVEVVSTVENPALAIVGAVAAAVVVNVADAVAAGTRCSQLRLGSVAVVAIVLWQLSVFWLLAADLWTASWHGCVAVQTEMEAIEVLLV